ncbi:MAG: hypothetical protein ACOC1X_01510, partial [Promethearchaeota archaeon]
IIVNRKDVEILDPQKRGNYPWIEGWIRNIKAILRKRLVHEKEQIKIPLIKKEVKKTIEKIEEVPQLSDEDREKLRALNEKIQKFLGSKKVRYWMEQKKVDRVSKELDKFLG